MTHLQRLLSFSCFPHFCCCLLKTGVRAREGFPPDKTFDQVQHFLGKFLQIGIYRKESAKWEQTWCTTLYREMSVICKTKSMQEKPISIWNVVHQDSFWNIRGKSNSEMAYKLVRKERGQDFEGELNTDTKFGKCEMLWTARYTHAYYPWRALNMTIPLYRYLCTWWLVPAPCKPGSECLQGDVQCHLFLD